MKKLIYSQEDLDLILSLETEEKDKEIERLNNIINEFEKSLIEEIEDYDNHINSKFITNVTREQYEGEKVCFEDMLGRLQELKGSNETSFEEMVNFVENVCKDIKNQLTLDEELEEEIEELQNLLQQKENIIKEGREYIESYNLEYLHETNEHNLADILEELLEILDKGGIK